MQTRIANCGCEQYLDFSFRGTFIPGTEKSTQELLLPWIFRSREAIVSRTFAPWNFRSSGATIPSIFVPGTFAPILKKCGDSSRAIFLQAQFAIHSLLRIYITNTDQFGISCGTTADSCHWCKLHGSGINCIGVRHCRCAGHALLPSVPSVENNTSGMWRDFSWAAHLVQLSERDRQSVIPFLGAHDAPPHREDIPCPHNHIPVEITTALKQTNTLNNNLQLQNDIGLCDWSAYTSFFSLRPSQNCWQMCCAMLPACLMYLARPLGSHTSVNYIQLLTPHTPTSQFATISTLALGKTRHCQCAS